MTSSTTLTNSAALVQEHEVSVVLLYVCMHACMYCIRFFSRNATQRQQQRVATEVNQLLQDIRRIGTSSENSCRFGDLFDDEHVQQYYEALVGTLQSAKKKGYIQYTGRLLLKGVSDDVVLSIVQQQEEDAAAAAGNQ